MKTVRDVIPSIRCLGSNTPLDQIWVKRHQFPKMYAQLLLECSKYQARLLRELWAPVLDSADLSVWIFWKKMTNTGRFPEFLDPSQTEAVLSAFRTEQ